MPYLLASEEKREALAAAVVPSDRAEGRTRGMMITVLCQRTAIMRCDRLVLALSVATLALTAVCEAGAPMGAAGVLPNALSLHGPRAASVTTVTAKPPPPAGVTLTNVTFPSGPASSGDITLFGTLVMPAATASPAPAVVLVAGSGPNDRWEDIGELAPFYTIAMELASEGYAVLTYDKRSCTGHIHPLCDGRTVCGVVKTPGCCLFGNMTVEDFATDAAAAVRFVTAQAGVQANGATVMGHSQGCTVAPVAAAMVPDLVDAVVLLMGDGTTIDVVMRDQMQVQLPLYQKGLAYWEKQPPSAQRTAAIAQINGTINAGECTIAHAVSQFDLLRDGTISPSQTDAVVCPTGVYWSGADGLPKGVSCPAACGTGVCELGHNTAGCLSACRVGVELAACLPARFCYSWMMLGEKENRLATWHSLSGRVLAINSWQDLLVVPPVFKPLHALLESLTNVDVTITTLTNVTHDLTTYGSATGAFSPKVMDAITSFLPKVAA